MAEQAESVAIPKRLPLVIEPQNRGNSTAYDAKIINAYVEKSKEGEYFIYERPGLDEQSRPPAGNATGRGVFQWNGSVYSIFGSTLYKDGVAVVGTVNATNGVYRFDSCLGATPKLLFGDGVKAYYYDSGGGLVNITDVDFPSSFCKGWAYLNGTNYVITPTAHIQGDDINDPPNWNPLNTILAQIEPDPGVAMAKQLVYVVALKQLSSEVFYDAGNPTGSPLGRVEGAKQNYGCLSADSVQDMGGQLFWLGWSKDGAPEVLMMENLKLDTVSTKPIERLLEGATLTNVFSWNIKIEGHRFYGLTLKDENLTLVYDMDEKMWGQWTDANGNYVPWVSSCATPDLRHIVQHESNGRLYLLSSDYATDDGDLIQVDIYTPNFDGGTRRSKQMGKLFFVSDQRAGGTLQVRVNDEDYNPKAWSNFRTVDLSQPVPYLDENGSFHRRVHNFRFKEPVRMPRMMAIEMQLDIGVA